MTFNRERINEKALQVAMFSLFTVIGFNARANEHHHETMSEAQPQVISATGVVKGIDLESKKSPSITIRLLP